MTAPSIAVVIGRDRITLWRELRRNQTRRGRPPIGGATAHRHRHDGLYRWPYGHQTTQRRADDAAHSKKRWIEGRHISTRPRPPGEPPKSLTWDAAMAEHATFTLATDC